MTLIAMSCPQCQCATVHKSRRRFFDWPMAVFGFKAARCLSCGIRFYCAPARLGNAGSLI